MVYIYHGLSGQCHPLSIQLFAHVRQLHVALCICTLCIMFLHSVVSTHACTQIAQPSSFSMAVARLLQCGWRLWQHSHPWSWSPPPSCTKHAPKCSLRFQMAGCRRRVLRMHWKASTGKDWRQTIIICKGRSHNLYQHIKRELHEPACTYIPDMMQESRHHERIYLSN